jgi:hypothetical protein
MHLDPLHDNYQEPKPVDYQCTTCQKLFEEWTGGLYWKPERKRFCPECVNDNSCYLHILDYCGGDAKLANAEIEGLEGC